MNGVKKGKRKFYLFLISNGMDCIGEKCTSIVLPIILYEITNDIYSTSLLMIARFMPKFLSNFLVKKISDLKVNTLLLLKSMAILRMIITVLFFFSTRPWQYYILSFILYLSGSLCYVYRYSFMKDICDEEELPIANNINSFMENVIMLLSIMGGGMIYAFLGLLPAIIISAVSFVASFMTLQIIKCSNAATKVLSGSGGVESGNRESFFKTIKRLSMQYQIVVLLIIVDAVASISFGSLNTVLPIVVQEHFSNSATTYSSMIVALSLGLILGNIVFHKLFADKNFLWTYILSTTFATIFFTILGCFYHILWFVLLLILVGLFNSIQDSALVSKVQLSVTEHKDVPFLFSIYQSLTALMILFSTFIVPYIIDKLGVLSFFIIFGVINFSGLFLLAIKWRSFQ